MSFDEDLGNGGRRIIPSARRSIHSYPNVSTNRGGMVRYGEDLTSDEERSGQIAGTDEVDNVMSKFSYSMSPPVMRRARIPQQTDDSDDIPLAKSLPATLPSHSNYSSDFGDKLWESVSTPRSRSNRSIDSGNTTFSTRSLSLSPKLNQSNHKTQEKYGEATIFKLLIVLLSIFSVAYYYGTLNFTLDSNQEKYDELKFHSDLTQLAAKYKVDDNSVLQLQTGISTIFRREDTSCFIFVYNSMKKDFDEINFDGFVNNVASNAAKFLRNDTSAVKHVVVQGSDLKMPSHTQLVKAYREDVARTGVLLIRDMAHVPSPVAMAFHYYCDEYNPLVKKSAIFFTLNTATCHNAGEKSSHASIEECLKKKWNTVPQDNIGPLLTRVVSVVVDVTTGK